MNIILNDAPYAFAGETLQALLIELGKQEPGKQEPDNTRQGFAVAINQQVVPKSLWSCTELTEHSQVFIFESIAGG